jgi:hypothetical protein
MPRESKKCLLMAPKKIFFFGLPSFLAYNCRQAILGTVIIPEATDVLPETKDADKTILLARKMNDTAMCLFNQSLTDKDSQMTLYNGITTELADGDAAKVWIKMFKLFRAKNINKMNESES